MSGLRSGVIGVSVHPYEPILAIAGGEGFVQLWNYKDALYPKNQNNPINNFEYYRKEDPNKIEGGKFFTAIEFTPDGTEILVPCYNGEIKIMDAASGEFKKVNTPPKTSDNKGFPIKQLIITGDNHYFSVSDTNKAVCLFKKETDPNKPSEWKFTGKIVAHEIEVTSIAFGLGLDEYGQPMHRLFSIGKDRRVFEYDVYKSTQEKLIVLRHFLIE